MGTAIITALAMLASSWLSVWMVQRFSKGLSVMPSMPGKVTVENDNGEAARESEPKRGRPVL